MTVFVACIAAQGAILHERATFPFKRLRLVNVIRPAFRANDVGVTFTRAEDDSIYDNFGSNIKNTITFIKTNTYM